MPSPSEITVPQLARLIGLPSAPSIIDIRSKEDFAANPQLVPGSVQHPFDVRPAIEPDKKAAVIICKDGTALSQGVAARLRHQGIAAETLEGGFSAWQAARQPLLRTAKLPTRDDQGRTVWVTRARPKIDRIACPWLIRRFIDPNAVFLFVAPTEVTAVAERFSAAAFDIEDVFWSHRGERCTFDIMIQEFGLEIPALHHVATIVRSADTARLDLAPEAAGLLAVSLGLSRMYRDDLEQLSAALVIYDGLYRWARDASDETHNWPTAHGAKS
ncbi:MAG: chromate resistance protein [Hyphomicrobium sp.]|nr:chromate resistance protein [Hyphomicrobium sp.]